MQSVSILLEVSKRLEILKIDAEDVCGSFLQRDRIRAGNIVESLSFLLREKHGIVPDYSEFAVDCKGYLGTNMDIIPEEEVLRLFDRFLVLMEEK